MGRLDEAQAAVLAKRHVAPGELELEGQRVVLGAKQHGLAGEGGALLAVLEDAVDEPGGLFVFVATGDEQGAAAAGALGPERLVVAFGGLGDDGVGGGQDGRRRAIVAFEREHPCRRKAVFEVEDVAHRGGAKAVDGLGVVAHAGDAAAARPQQRDDLGLQRVRVLILVDQHVIESFAHPRPGGRVGEQGAPEEEQVVVVEHLLLLFGIGVAREEPAQALAARLAPREGLDEYLGQRLLGVDAARVDVEAGRLLGESCAVASELERRTRHV